MNVPEIDKIKSLQLDAETIEIPEFRPIGKVDTSYLKLEYKVIKRKNNSRIFNFFMEWAKLKSD